MAFRLVDEIEAFTHVFVYEGGTLHLPSFFRCRDVNITVWSVFCSCSFCACKEVFRLWSFAESQLCC